MDSIDTLLERLHEARTSATKLIPKGSILNIHHRYIGAKRKNILYINYLGELYLKSGTEYHRKEIDTPKQIVKLYKLFETTHYSTAQAIRDLTKKIRKTLKEKYSTST